MLSVTRYDVVAYDQIDHVPHLHLLPSSPWHIAQGSPTSSAFFPTDIQRSGLAKAHFPAIEQPR